MIKILSVILLSALGGCSALKAEQEAKQAAIEAGAAEFDRQQEAAYAAQRKQCLAKGGPEIGMTKKQVVATCWGEPRHTNTTQTAYGYTEQMVYQGGYVYLRNGIVTAVQY